jgi:hypothetical protein
MGFELTTLVMIGTVVVVIVWQLDLQLPVQSVPIITKVVSSNPIHGEVYSIHYVIKFVSDKNYNLPHGISLHAYYI